MGMMSKAEARRFKEGWRLVNEFTNEEARHKSASERLRELEMLYQFGKEMGLTKQDDEREEVWARWNRLREIAGV